MSVKRISALSMSYVQEWMSNESDPCTLKNISQSVPEAFLLAIKYHMEIKRKRNGAKYCILHTYVLYKPFWTYKKKVSDYCEDCACPGFPHALKQTAVRRLNMVSFLFCFFMDLDVSIQCTLSHLEQ